MKTKPAQVAMLPTENKTILKKFYMVDTYQLLFKQNHIIAPYQHLYFLSDEEIKEGDWYYDTILKAIGRFPCMEDSNPCKKIIASTDPSLGLPAIPLTWIRDVYVPSNGFIKEVKLELEFNHALKSMATESRIKLTPDNEVCITDWHDGKVWNEIWLGEPQPCKLTCIRPSNERQVQTVLIPSSGIEPLYQETYKRSIVTDQELEDVAKDHADNWWDSEPDPETDKHFTDEFNEAKKKWAKHDFICGFEQGANWKAEQLAKEIESRTEVIKEYQKAIDQSANDAMSFVEWVHKQHYEIPNSNIPITWTNEGHRWPPNNIYTTQELYELWGQTRNK